MAINVATFLRVWLWRQYKYFCICLYSYCRQDCSRQLPAVFLYARVDLSAGLDVCCQKSFFDLERLIESAHYSGDRPISTASVISWRCEFFRINQLIYEFLTRINDFKKASVFV
jgi:hypothetical protein